MYALDRHSGEKLWEINAGFGIQQAQMDIEREHVTLFTDFNPDKKSYNDRVRQLRLNDGKVMWGFNPKQGYEVNYVTAAKNVVVVDSRLSETSNGGHLSVLNSKNGKILWTRKLNMDYQLLNQRAEDPYVLYWDKGKLTAADPLTGRVVWNIVAKKSTVDHPENNPYFDGIYRKDPFQSAKPERWMLLADQWTLVDLNTGKKREHFAAKQEQQIEVLNDGMVLIRENKHGDQYGEYEDFTTTLYDPQRGQKRWSVNAKIERGLVENEQVYVIRNGSPAALEYKTGKLRWSVKQTLGTVSHTINQGSYTLIDDQLLLPMRADLLVFNSQNGELLGRVYDIVTGEPEHRERQAKNGAINRIGDEVYIGSSNGRFSLYQSKDLLTEMVQ
nr:PQQ-binding-like beta-propeller repeat protein [Paenibacillus sp. ACRSA]